ncbi:MAG: phosphohydrolase [Flavobacterium sp.]|uniref:Pycsar system effector family protein n=1 Tax=Flavobacterium sp. TaxID=239 RepID=UPI0011FA989E|nr:Pycsar system effector family protein [Flavobacterium sp.]RZJ66393.1 MAG: phosphohydrolase [Flavobacterium sp.]
MTLLEKAEAYVSALFKDKLSASFTYHNFKHTKRVVKAAQILASSENLTPDETTAIELAAWFHDSGYVNGADRHEQKSIAIFNEFASQENIPDDIASLAKNLIAVTEMCNEPVTLLENIMRDADSSHFGSEDYEKIAGKLREEWSMQGKTFSDYEWCSGNIKMLTKLHSFRTAYALENWQPQKDANIKSIQEKIQHMEPEIQENPEKKKKKKDKKDKPDRGIETMFRVTLSNHTQLSQIADSKANILLSVNAIIISIALSTLIPKLDSPTNAHLVLPTFILLLFSVISIVFAILATRPKINSATYLPSDIEDRKVNLLFFGNFHQIPHDDYQIAMKELMRDREYLYESLIKDLYYLGKVLHRKYRLLHITYNIFMFGIIISTIAFVVAFKSF